MGCGVPTVFRGLRTSSPHDQKYRVLWKARHLAWRWGAALRRRLGRVCRVSRRATAASDTGEGLGHAVEDEGVGHAWRVAGVADAALGVEQDQAAVAAGTLG